MKSFKDYLTESSKSYTFVIKFAGMPTDEQVSVIETWLKKYDLKEFSKPSLIEDNHRDFIDIPNREVFGSSAVLGLPISQFIILKDLVAATDIPEKFIIVRGEHEPIEQYSEYDVWSRQEDELAKKDNLVPDSRLSTDREYTQAEQPLVTDLYGDEYNKKLLSYLAGVAKNRPDATVNACSPLFTWLEDIAPGEPMQDTSDFNEFIKGAPKPVKTEDGIDEQPIDSSFMNIHGSVADTAKPNVKFFKDPKSGTMVQVQQPVRKKI